MFPTDPHAPHLSPALSRRGRPLRGLSPLGRRGGAGGDGNDQVLLTITVGSQDWPEVDEKPSFSEIGYRVSAPR